MTAGSTVTLSSSLGPIDRIVVQMLEDVVLICRKEEYERARHEQREPVTMAFRRSDVIAEK